MILSPLYFPRATSQQILPSLNVRYVLSPGELSFNWHCNVLLSDDMIPLAIYIILRVWYKDKSFIAPDKTLCSGHRERHWTNNVYKRCEFRTRLLKDMGPEERAVSCNTYSFLFPPTPPSRLGNTFHRYIRTNLLLCCALCWERY